MFPRPIQQTSAITQNLYKIALPIALLFWLFPLLGVAVTSVRPASDLAQGNYFGMPSYIAFENYADVFRNSDIGRYILNSFKLTIPVVIGAVALSTMTGFALGIYKFRSNLLVFFLFVAGNFVPFQILMVPVRDLTYQMGLINTTTGLALFHIAFQTGFCTLFMRNFIKALPFELIEAARVEGVSEVRIFWYIVLPLMRPAIAALSVLIFTFIWNDYFWATVLTTSREAPADHGRPELAEWPMDRRLATGFRRLDHRCHAAGIDVFPDAETLHRGPHHGGGKVKTWRIDSPAQTIALASSGGIPEVIHWGPRLPDGEDLAQLALSSVQDLTGGMIDALPALSLTPEPGRAFQGQPGLMLSEADGTPLCPPSPSPATGT